MRRRLRRCARRFPPVSRVKTALNASTHAVVPRAGVPRRTAVAVSAAVGAVGSLATLALAYREPLNRCRCERASASGGASASGRSFPPRAHCARCRKRTRFGVALSFVFSPAYVAVMSGATALAAHEVGRRALRMCRRAFRGVGRRLRDAAR